MAEPVAVADYTDKPCPNCKRPVRWRVKWHGEIAALLPDEPGGGPHACLIYAATTEETRHG